MQKALRFFAKHAEKFTLSSVLYFFSMAFFTDSFGEFVGYVWPALIVGLLGAAIIFLKTVQEFQEADQKASALV